MEENLVTKAMANMIVDGTLDNIKKTDPKRYNRIMGAEVRVCLGEGLGQGKDYLGDY